MQIVHGQDDSQTFLYQDKMVIYWEKWFLSCWLINSKLTVIN